MTCPKPPGDINRALLDSNILGGLDVNYRVPNGMLLCVTEMNAREDIDALVSALSRVS